MLSCAAELRELRHEGTLTVLEQPNTYLTRSPGTAMFVSSLPPCMVMIWQPPYHGGGLGTLLSQELLFEMRRTV
jgi:hypothetical protein